MTSPFVTIDSDRAIRGAQTRANVTVSPDLALSHWLRMDGEKSCQRIATALNATTFNWAYKEMPDRIDDIDDSL
jgi:hypothetical protein